MKGSHHIIIETSRIKYEFTIRRNLTIIRGDSATGKTTLVDLLQDYSRGESATSIRLTSDVPCIVYSGQDADWHLLLTSYSGSIIFIDEEHTFIRTKEFAETIRQTDNYYVLITRESLPMLPYSINEIYGIRTSGRFHYPEQVYHEFYPIYESAFTPVDAQASTRILLTEDGQSGFQFLQASAASEVQCTSSEGNAGVYQVLRSLPKGGEIAIVADGAAFGAFIERVLSLMKYRKDTMLFLPESFEWMILKSGILNAPDLSEILAHPEDYIDSKVYFSWEQFFSSYLTQLTAEDNIRKYQKNHLLPFYTEGQNRDKIVAIFPQEMKNYFSTP